MTMPTDELGGGGEEGCEVEGGELVASEDQGGEGGWVLEGGEGGQVVGRLKRTGLKWLWRTKMRWSKVNPREVR